MSDSLSIAKNLQHVRDRIQKVSQALQHRPHVVQLLAVSKKKSAALIRQAYRAGQRLFGENYVQEALPKIYQLQDLTDISFHFIGNIQSNKTKSVARHFTWVHSVDRKKIAQRLNEHRSCHLPALNICLKVNIDREQSKSGMMHIEQVYALANFIQLTCPRLKLRGLMAIPKFEYDFDRQRRAYKRVKEMFCELNQAGITLDTLSMGMSVDLEAAIAQGATIVRVGRAIFGVR
jgi:pyridoxal phosphate enzyme (YggS family)